MAASTSRFACSRGTTGFNFTREMPTCLLRAPGHADFQSRRHPPAAPAQWLAKFGKIVLQRPLRQASRSLRSM